MFFLSASFFSQGYRYEFIPPPLAFIHQAHLIALAFIFSALFARDFLQLNSLSPVLNKIVLGSIPYNGFALLTYPALIQLSGTMLWISMVLSPSLFFYCGFYAWRRSYKPARFYVLSLVIFVPFAPLAVMNILTANNIPFLTFITQHSFKLFLTTQILLMSIAILDRISNINKDKIKAQDETLAIKESYNQELELEVQDRTQELYQEKKRLRIALNETEQLKKQQDGDYYLTSLLIDPLSRISTNSPNVHVSSFIRQKKQFSFHKWDAELGGDFNAAHTLNFDGQPRRTVFINADAMGKSMQGAGGALVLGSAFQSIIEQTLTNPEAFNQGPQHWLINTFHAMDHIFQSFDGAMLVSLVMGILEEDSGYIFWLNAEHPQPVLYREGTAELLGDQNDTCPKLGDKIGTKKPIVLQQQLHPGDIFISGSDGRDDIKLKGADNNNFTVNSDETIFLDIVLLNQGNLEGIYQSLQNQGTIIDDVSLLRLEFLGNSQ